MGSHAIFDQESRVVTSSSGVVELKQDFERRIRVRGSAIDVAHTRSLYEPLHDSQPRTGVLITRGLANGPDTKQRVDVYLPEILSDRRQLALLFCLAAASLEATMRTKRTWISTSHARATQLL